MLREIVLEKINNQSELTLSDCKRLQELGFKRPTTVEDFLVRDKYKEYIEQYKFLYPQNPFITKFQIREILVENENLRLDDASNFGYSIPYKNIQEILNFKIKEEFLEDGKWMGDNGKRCNFFVIAPRTMFYTESRQKFDPDPIVLCRVKGGYLLITSWGDEVNLISNPNIN